MFTQVLNRNLIKTVLFLERKFTCVHRSPVGFGLILFTRVHNRIGRKHFPPKQTKESHLLTKFNKHGQMRGKFILLNLKSIGKIVESYAFKIYRTAVCLQESRQQTPSEKESFVKYQERQIYNKILNLTSIISPANPNFSKLTKGYRDINVTACN